MAGQTVGPRVSLLTASGPLGRRSPYPAVVDAAGVLLRTPIFRDLAVEDVDALVADVRVRRYGRGEVVWLEGDPAEELFVVAEGQLKSSRVSLDGREVILALHPADSVTGEVGLFHPRGVRWLTVTAMTPATCLTLRRAPLVRFLARHPASMERMMAELASRAVKVAYSFSGVAFDGIQQRVATMLVELVGQYGEETPDGLRIGVRLSQGELAAHVAASRENVNRALSGLVGNGVLTQRAGHFHVHDLAALTAVAAGDGAG